MTCVSEKAPNDQSVEALLILCLLIFQDVTVTDVAELVKFVIFAIPSPIRTNLSTSVETNVLADAVIVLQNLVVLKL